jgi:putative cell wall-binding protein
VRQQVSQAVPGATVQRIAGTDRYATSAAIAGAGWSGSTWAYFAAGTDFPDALAGVAAAAVRGAPLLLTRRGCMPAPIAETVAELDPDDTVLLGGSSALSDSAATRHCRK